jgi:mannose-1-phosphate guanylyltransferase
MAGGKGERFWPLSTEKRPKQLLALVGDKPLIAQAVDRLRGVIPPQRTLVITGAALVPAVRAAAPRLPATNIVGEPFGRDTAAACALGTALVRARDPRGVVCILTADQVIADAARFRAVLGAAIARAARGRDIVTMGIRPTFASTGFGYIETGEPCGTDDGVRFRRAVRFVEKPDRRTAEKYVRRGNFLWNSGMFVWSVACFMEALGRHAPALRGMADRLAPQIGKAGFGRTLRREYGRLERISVDYAVMEKSDNIVTAPGDFGWDDVGSWAALERHFEGDAEGSVVIGSCASLDAGGNVVVSRERLTALVGVRDLVVVQARGATLVCHKSRAEDVKKLVHALRRDARRYGSLL